MYRVPYKPTTQHHDRCTRARDAEDAELGARPPLQLAGLLCVSSHKVLPAGKRVGCQPRGRKHACNAASPARRCHLHVTLWRFTPCCCKFKRDARVQGVYMARDSGLERGMYRLYRFGRGCTLFIAQDHDMWGFYVAVNIMERRCRLRR